jgi:hypothetical protein
MMMMQKWKLEFEVHLEIITSREDVKEFYQECLAFLKERMIDIQGKEIIKGKMYLLNGSMSD